MALSRSSVLRMRTNAMVVEISRSSVPFSWRSKADERRHLPATADVRAGVPAGSRRAPARRSRRYSISRLSSSKREERHFLHLLVGHRQVEAVAELLQRVLAHLLLLVGDVLALAGLAHAVALDRLGEDDASAGRLCSTAAA